MNLPVFMNSPLAWGALAFCIPLILHIMNRSRFKRVEWGAMHLLESVVKVNHKRFQLEQLLLLLVRCSIPALLAFALAKPVLTGAKALAGESPVSLVMLLDTSYSMEAGNADATHFDEALAAAIAVIQAVPRGSEISVIQTGGSPTPLFDKPVLDNQAVIRRLRTLKADYGASDMQQSLDLGIAALAGMTHARRELIIFSDFQPADWKGSNAADAIQQQISAMNIKPELTLLQLGQPVKGNVSVDSLDFSNRPLGVGQTLTVRANLRNHGEGSATDARVILKVDGQERAVSQVSLGANAMSQALFPCEFETPGSHVFEVEVLVDDPLKSDNRLAAAVTIWDQIDVLLVDGDPSSEPLKSETDFLSIALTPYTFGRMKLSDLVRTKTVNYQTNLKKQLEEKPQVVVLANVPKLSDAQANELQDYVKSGGSLLVCAGSRIDSRWYNKMLFQQRNLLPAEFGAPRGQINNEGQSVRIVAQHFDHPALQFFNEPANGDLSTAEIRQWFELKLPDSAGGTTSAMPGMNHRAGVFSVARFIQSRDETRSLACRLGLGGDGLIWDGLVCDHGLNGQLVSGLVQSRWTAESAVAALLRSSLITSSLLVSIADASEEPKTESSAAVVIARLDNGDPLLVEKSFGDGVVIQMATAVDSDWSDLPLKPFYVPMMQQIVTTMATQLSTPRNIRTGETAVALFPTEPDNTDGNDVLLTMSTPDGAQKTVRTSPQGNSVMARFDDTSRPGVYSMTTPDAQTLHFVASTAREESDLRILDKEQLQSLADSMGGEVVESSAQYLEQDRLRRNGRDIWRFVLAAFLAFLFLELLLQQRFSRVRS